MPKLIDKKALRILVPYSQSQISRLEAKGQFPKRVQLGPSRVAWVEEEVLDWIAGKAAERADAGLRTK